MKVHKLTAIGALVVGAILSVGISDNPVQAQAMKTSCESLASTALPNTKIKSTQTVAAGTFTPPVAQVTNGGSPFVDLPAFCRVIAAIEPVSGSTINIEVWLPANWNGTFQGWANGLWAGNIDYNSMGQIIRVGAAAAATDTGHTGTPNTPPTDWYDWQTHREQIIDFDWRSFHETTLKAKSLIAAYYTAPLTLSYIIHPAGLGTRQAMKEMAQFPEDYDAIVVGGLASHQTHHALGQIWAYQATHKTPEHYIPPEKYPAIHQAALDACHAVNGIILDPPRCKFDPGVLLCKGADAPTCLTAPQVEAARQLYTPPITSDTKEVIFGPLMRGSELGWTEMAGPKSSPFGTQLLAYLVFKQGPNWDPMTLKFDSETLARVDAPEIQPMNAWDPDISKFIARGGKLLLMGGWGDASIDPGLNVDYYEHVMQVVGEKARDSVRLFMVPGMGHAPGRNGPNAYDTDLMAAIKQWKATNKAPDDLIFTHWVNGVATNKALVCAYPEVVTYKGSGDTIDPESFTCKPGAHVGWEPKAAEKRK